MNFDGARDLVERELLPRHGPVEAAIIGGSLARDDGTATSDIDLFLLFGTLPHAWRETLVVAGRTVELYAHDLGTFEYFCRRIDGPGGRIPVAMMVIEGKNILPPTPAYARLLGLANAIRAEGPPRWSAEALASRRYEITTLLEDLVDSAAPEETVAVAAKLYDLLANFVLRAGGAWTGVGKHLIRRLKQFDAPVAAELDAALRLVVVDPPAGKKAFGQLAGRVLEPYGGPLLGGYRLQAPPEWTLTPPTEPA